VADTHARLLLARLLFARLLHAPSGIAGPLVLSTSITSHGRPLRGCAERQNSCDSRGTSA
jgi:hypothetical protein